jgi:hypothetical protein
MDYIVAPDPDGRHPDIYIAEIGHSDDEGRVASPEQQDANRHLIAAAPELLEALHSLLAAAGDIDAAIDGVTDEFDAELATLRSTCVVALAAILKATLSQSRPQSEEAV